MKYLIALFIVALSACAAPPVVTNTKIVTEYKYIVKLPPTELVKIPELVAFLDLTKNPTDVQISEWLLANEKRTNQLELQLNSIKQFYQNILKTIGDKKGEIIID